MFISNKYISLRPPARPHSDFFEQTNGKGEREKGRESGDPMANG